VSYIYGLQENMGGVKDLRPAAQESYQLSKKAICEFYHFYYSCSLFSALVCCAQPEITNNYNNFMCTLYTVQ
jgi:hypothetical protein